MSTEKLKKSVANWKETVDANAFADSVTAFAESTASASPLIDKISTWAAGGTATVAGLAITNIDKMSTAYNICEVKWLFSCLALSIIFAILQKYLSLICAGSLQVSAAIKNSLPAVLETFSEHEQKIKEMSDAHNLDIKAEYDFSKVLQAYLALFPKWSLFFLKSKFNKSIADRNYPHKSLITSFVTQSFCAFIQYLLIVVFVGLAAIFL